MKEKNSHIFVFRRTKPEWIKTTQAPISREGALLSARKAVDLGMCLCAAVETTGFEPVLYPGGMAVPQTYRGG